MVAEEGLGEKVTVQKLREQRGAVQGSVVGAEGQVAQVGTVDRAVGGDGFLDGLIRYIPDADLVQEAQSHHIQPLVVGDGLVGVHEYGVGPVAEWTGGGNGPGPPPAGPHKNGSGPQPGAVWG